MAEQTSVPTTPEASSPPAARGGSIVILGRGFSPGAIIAWVAILALLTLLAFGLLRSQKGPVAQGEPAPDFSLVAFNGEQFRLKDLRGKVVLINFWASWCIPCETEAEYLESAWQYYRGRGDVVFLGVDYVDTESKASIFLEKYNVTYPNGPDLGTRISQAYRIIGVPETYIVGRDGKLAYVKIAPFSSLREIRAAIDPLLLP